MKNKKKIALVAVVLAVVLIIAGTFAWFTTTDQVANIFEMDNFDVTLTEDFDPSEVPLNPGTDVTKQVGVTNHGNVDVLVRIRLEEALSLLEQEQADGVDKLKVVYEDKKGEGETQYVPVLISDTMIDSYEGTGYASYTDNAPEGITVLRKKTETGDNTVYSYLAYVTDPATEGSAYHHLVQVTPEGENSETPDGFTVKYAYNLRKDAGGGQYTVTAVHDKDDTSLDTYYDATSTNKFHNAVVLNFDTNVSLDGTVEATDTWVLMSDGYFYYTKALKGETISDPLLESVSISKDAGNALKGATYTITPIMQAVQLDYEAAKATWDDMGGTPDPAGVAAVTANQAHQLVYNIVNNDGIGYVA